MSPDRSARSQMNVPPRFSRRSTVSPVVRSICCAIELAEDDLLGEVLRADADHGVARGRRERRCRRDEPGRRPAPRPAATASGLRERAADAQRALGEQQRAVDGQRQQRGRHGPGEDHGRVDHRQAAEDVFAEAAGADRGGDRRGADADDRRDADARRRSTAAPAAARPARAAAAASCRAPSRPRPATRSTPRTPATVVRMIGSSA